jgi:class 3 adenylate cyclase
VRRSLFAKYFLALFTAVVVPLLANGVLEAWFGYRDQRAAMNQLLQSEAGAAAARIEGFVEGIMVQLGWMVHLPWSEGANERQRIDALRLFRQVPAIISLTLVDGESRERLHISRVGVNRFGIGEDKSSEPAVQGARASRRWYGPVTYYRGSEPFMTVAIAGNRPEVGAAVAEINLKLAWDVIAAIRVGKLGHAFVLDDPGRLIAHPDLSLVLRGADTENLRPFQELRAAIVMAGGEPATGEDAQGRAVMAAMARVPGVNWTVLVEQPLSEAFGPIYAALWRTGTLLLLGAVFAAALAFWLARRMAKPIRLLEQGVERVGAGQFDYRIRLETGDELERLASRVNEMAAELAISQERQERIARLKRFLAPQVAELVDRAGDDALLDGQRAEVVAIFCDLRGFTAFSNRADPEEVMAVLSNYYRALGSVIDQHQATLASFQGDGLMVLVNAPVRCPEPGRCAVKIALDMQSAVRELKAEWSRQGHAIGFGVGMAMGLATVGRVGTDSRAEYTAIGRVVNLAARLCALAGDGQVLVDAALADAVRSAVHLDPLGAQSVKGYEHPVEVFIVAARLAEVHYEPQGSAAK